MAERSSVFDGVAIWSKKQKPIIFFLLISCLLRMKLNHYQPLYPFVQNQNKEIGKAVGVFGDISNNIDPFSNPIGFLIYLWIIEIVFL